MAQQLKVAVAVAEDPGLVSSSLTVYVTVKSDPTYSLTSVTCTWCTDTCREHTLAHKRK